MSPLSYVVVSRISYIVSSYLVSHISYVVSRISYRFLESRISDLVSRVFRLPSLASPVLAGGFERVRSLLADTLTSFCLISRLGGRPRNWKIILFLSGPCIRFFRPDGVFYSSQRRLRSRGSINTMLAVSRVNGGFFESRRF